MSISFWFPPFCGIFVYYHEYHYILLYTKYRHMSSEKEREFAKQQVKLQNENLEVANGDNSSVFDLNLSDIDEARRAFIASEIFNKKYC